MTLLNNIPAPRSISSWNDLLAAIDAFHADYDGDRYHSRHETFAYHANVKMGSRKQFADFDDAWSLVIRDIPVAAPFRSLLETEFGQTELSRIWWDWLGSNQRYVCDDWLTGATHMTTEAWNTVRSRLLHGEKSGYSAIDSLTDLPSRMAQVDDFAGEDSLWLEAFDQIDRATAGFYGRCGGNFCFKPNFNTSTLAQIAGEIENLPEEVRLTTLDREGYDFLGWVDSLATFRRVERAHHLCRAVAGEVGEMAKGLDFTEELSLRIQEKWSELEVAADPKEAERRAGLVLTLRDSILAGNGEADSRNWAAVHFPGRSEITIAEALAVEDQVPAIARVVRFKLREANLNGRA